MIRFFRVSGIALLRFRPYDRRRAEAEKPESGQEAIFFEYFLSFIPANGLIFRKAALNFSMRDYFSIVSARMKG